LTTEKTYETTVRLDSEIADRLGIIAQVLGISRNTMMKRAITESVIVHEGDPEYQKQRKKWIDKLSNVGT
jgi:predicted transcriptional regulator